MNPFIDGIEDINRKFSYWEFSDDLIDSIGVLYFILLMIGVLYILARILNKVAFYLRSDKA